LAGAVQEYRRSSFQCCDVGQQLLAPGAAGTTDVRRWRLAWGQHQLPLGIEAPPLAEYSDILIVRFSGKSTSARFNI